MKEAFYFKNDIYPLSIRLGRVIKKAGLSILVVLLFLVSSGPALVQARTGLRILSSSAEPEFPFALNFNLSAESNVDITDIRLHYIVDHASYAQATSEVYIDFPHDTTVDVDWSLEMRKIGGLPPGSELEYWWTVVDARGDNIQTTPTRIYFDDNRYSWAELTEGKVTISWYEGEQSFAEELMLAAQQALKRLAEDTGAQLKRQVKIYIYANNRDLLGAMISPQEWTGGVNFFRYSIIAIGIPTKDLEWGKRAIAHELTHQVTYQVTMNPYNYLPRWLNEGLSMYAEGPLEPFFEAYLSMAVMENSLISVRSLSSPFSAYGNEAYLSYAQSYSLVELLIGTYGQNKMLELLMTFSEGSSYDGALENVYGFDMDGLDTLWREYIFEKYEKTGVQISEKLSGINRNLSEMAGRIILNMQLIDQRWVWEWI